MEMKKHKKLIQNSSAHLTAEEYLKKLEEMPTDYSRAGQSFVTFLPQRKSAMKNLSEKELYLISREANIQAMMKSTELTREEVEKMLGNPF